MGWLKKEIMPALMTAGGATAMAFGQPEGIPMLIAGLGSGIGSAVGGPAGQGIASAGQLASLPADPGAGPMGAEAGAAGGGAPSLTETALSGGTTALPEMAPVGRGISDIAPMLQKYRPLELPPPPPVKRTAPPKAPEPPPPAQTPPPDPMRALAAYREFLHRLEALAEPSDDGGHALQIEELAQMFRRGS